MNSLNPSISNRAKIDIRNDANYSDNRAQVILIFVFLSISIIVAEIGAKVGVSVIQYFATIVFLFTAFIAKSKYSLPIVIFSLFNTKTLVLFGVSCSTLLTIILVLKSLLLKNNKKVIMVSEFVFLAFFSFYEIIMASFGMTSNMFMLIKFWFSVVFLRFFLSENYGKQWMEDCFSFLFIGYIITVVTSILMNPSAIYEQRVSINDSGANMTGIFSSFIMAYSLYFLLDASLNKTLKIQSLISAVLSTIIGILSASRMFVLTAALTVALLVLASLFLMRGKVLKRVLIVLSIFIVGFIIIQSSGFLGDKISYIVQRIVEPTHGDISNERFEIWSQYFDKLSNNRVFLLFGFDYTKVGLSAMAHNAIIEQIATYGIVGNILIIVFLFAEWRNITFSVKVSHFSYLLSLNNLHLIPLFTIIVSGMTSHSFMTISKTILLIFSFFCFYYHAHTRKSLRRS